MSTQGRKTSQCPTITSVGANDHIVVVATVNSVTNTHLVSTSDLLGNSNVAVVGSNLVSRRTTTPSNSTSSNCRTGEVWSDGTYIYVGTANNVCKRALLSTF